MLGAGAVGSYIGSKLVEHGFTNVDFIARSGYNALKEKGLLVKNYTDKSPYYLKVNPLKELQGEYDVILICVKSKDTITAAKQAADHLKDDGFVVSIQNGVENPDIISAFIKSIRGSDPDAALYWLARMIEGGEDPAFIARRLVISASEDIGLANPNALLLANAAFDAVMKIGWPEGRIPLAEATVYLATSAKSNSAYMGINDALQLVRQTGNLPVPLHLRNAPTKLMEELGYHKGYKYAHDYEGHFVEQQFLPDELVDRRIWHAQPNAAENKLQERMILLWKERYKA